MYIIILLLSNHDGVIEKMIALKYRSHRIGKLPRIIQLYDDCAGEKGTEMFPKTKRRSDPAYPMTSIAA